MAAPPPVPGYRFLRPLGEGAMGQVWVVEPTALPGVQRALKALPRVDDAVLRERFRREADLLARVEGHPNLTRVHDAGEVDGRPWMVVGLIEGEDLGRRLARGGPVPWREAVGLVAQVARGLAHVHRHGVLHRDVKPWNIVVDGDGRAILVDFGVAWADDLGALTRTGLVVGTPAYFSPEQARGEPLDARSDVHALGATLFELLTGRIPFAEGPSPADTLQRILNQPAPAASAFAPGVPAAVDEVLLRALAKTRDARPADADELAVLLGSTLGQAAPKGPKPRPLVGVALGALGGTLVVGALWVALRRDPTAPSTSPTITTPPATAPSTGAATPGGVAATPAEREAEREADDLVALLDRGEAATVLGRLHRRRASSLGPAAGRVEEAARRLVLTAPPATRVDALRALARARALSPEPRPGGGELVDAVLRATDTAASTSLGGGQRDDLADLLEALAATGLRPIDVPAAERFVDRIYELHHTGLLGGDAYARSLAAAVQLDIDLHADHLRSFLPPASARGLAVDLLTIRGRLFDAAGRDDDDRFADALVDLRQLLAARGDQLGPVTRARATSLAAPLRSGLDTLRPWVPRLEQAWKDDPRNPSVGMVLALALATVGRPSEACEIQRKAFDAAKRQAERVTFRGWERVVFFQSGVRLLMRLDLPDEARARLEEMRAFAPPQLVADLEAEVSRR